MSFGEYLLGVAGLAAVAAPIGLAAVHLRLRLLPGWEGAPARLVEAVVGLSILTVLLQLLGAIGLFHPTALVVASLAVGAGVLYWSSRAFGAPFLRIRQENRPGGAGSPPAPAIPTVQLVIALLAAVFLATHWATGLQDVWGRGMLTFDTLWYHGPFAARAAETGSIWGLHFTDPLYLNWFYPQNSELLHGAGIALFDRDLLSPLINFGFLGLALLAAWTIGRPYGVAPLSLIAVALILDTGPIVPREAGTPANDMAPVALLLAAAAIVINLWAARAPRDEGGGEGAAGRGPARKSGEAAERPPAGGPVRWGLFTAGLALGLALGTKLTVAGGVAAFAVGVPLLMPPGLRKRAVLYLLGGISLTAGFWFLRNLIHSGNPLPWIQDIGPIDLPGPGRGLEGRDDYTVSHYIFENPDAGVWSDFRKSITNLLGPLWFLLLAAPAAGAALALWRPRSAAVRLCGAVTVAAAIAYLFTPLTAAGPEGDPRAFGINLRYLVPALALGLALLPLEPKLTPQRFRLPLLLGGLAALAITSQYSDSAYIWDEPFASLPVAVLIGLVLIAVPVGIALLARRSALPAAIAAGVVILAVGAAGWERQDDYLDSRYASADDFRFEFDQIAEWAKPTSDLRIAVVGTSGAYNQYLLYGDELSNRVDYLGRKEGGGNFVALENCPQLREAVNDGDYDYVVTTPDLDLNSPEDVGSSPERGWLVDALQLDEQIRTAKISIFRVNGDLDPAGCSHTVKSKLKGEDGKTTTIIRGADGKTKTVVKGDKK